MSATEPVPPEPLAEERQLVAALGEAAKDHPGPLSTDEIDAALGLDPTSPA